MKRTILALGAYMALAAAACGNPAAKEGQNEPAPIVQSAAHYAIPPGSLDYSVIEGRTPGIIGERPDAKIRVGGLEQSLTLDYHDTIIGQLGGPSIPPYKLQEGSYPMNPNFWSAVIVPDDASYLDQTKFGRDEAAAKEAAVYSGLKASAKSSRALDLLMEGNNPSGIKFNLEDIPLTEGFTLRDFRDAKNDSIAMLNLFTSASMGNLSWYTVKIPAGNPDVTLIRGITWSLSVLKQANTLLVMDATDNSPYWNLASFVFNGRTGTNPDSVYVDGVMLHVLPGGKK